MIRPACADDANAAAAANAVSKVRCRFFTASIGLARAGSGLARICCSRGILKDLVEEIGVPVEALAKTGEAISSLFG